MKVPSFWLLFTKKKSNELKQSNNKKVSWRSNQMRVFTYRINSCIPWRKKAWISTLLIWSIFKHPSVTVICSYFPYQSACHSKKTFINLVHFFNIKVMSLVFLVLTLLHNCKLHGTVWRRYHVQIYPSRTHRCSQFAHIHQDHKTHLPKQESYKYITKNQKY